tara:strand:- start:395 stop:1150 length:756 start_codon:yes stop_codon:yes gene_type:complete
MKLTKQTLKGLIREVIEEKRNNSMILTEMMNPLAGTPYEKMGDINGPAQFCFITAHEPPVKKVSKAGGHRWDNDEQQRRLIQELNSLGYEFTKGKGVYGGTPEESLMVFSKDNRIQGKFKLDMIRLGKKYLQDAIVYAEKYMGAAIDTQAGEYPSNTDTGAPLPEKAGFQGESGPRIYWNMQMLLLKPTKTMEPSQMHEYEVEKQSNLFMTGPAIQVKKNFYTIMQGMKSYIPFYDDDREEFIANPFPARR